MPVSDEVFVAAMRTDPQAVRSLLKEHYPVVHRLACSLGGQESAARAIERYVMTRCLQARDRWRDATAAERWFHHHTILAARRDARQLPAPQEDILLSRADAQLAEYVAFVRALRTLPFQQREAFILRYCENWQMRPVAVAMDCSTHAVEVHVRQAEEMLKTVAGQQYDDFRNRLVATYALFTPKPKAIDSAVAAYAAIAIRPIRLGKFRKLLLLIVILLVAFVVWYCLRS